MRSIAILAACLVTLSATGQLAPVEPTAPKRVPVPGEIVVCFESDNKAVDLPAVVDGWELQAAEAAFVAEEARPLLQWRRPGAALFTNVVLVRFPVELDAGPLLDHLAGRADVVWSAANTECIGDVKELVPNDPLYGVQYHHPLMSNDQAWDVTQGAGVILAITDDGTDIDHVDLVQNVWTNPGEIAGNGVDDDGNGYVDDVNGWDFVSGNNNPNPNSSGDDHGTHVGGICAGRTGNAVGIAGTAGQATLLPVQFYAAGQPWTAANIAAAFAYAVDNGARIISMSYNLDSWVGDPVFTAGLQYVYDSDCLHFNSGGNAGSLNPARQAFHQTLLVASTDASDNRSSFSNYGTGTDIAAPGSTIRSTLLNDTYGDASGTSMASPNAAAVAALIWSVHPTWTRDQVAAQLYATADNLDAQNPGLEGLLGGGRVNSFAAVTTASLPAPQVASLLLPNLACGGSSLTLRFDQIMDPASVNGAGAFELVHAGGDDVFDTGDDSAIPLSASNYMIGSNEIIITPGAPLTDPGRYRLRVTAAVANPFGTAIDGDGDGTGGDPWDRIFSGPNMSAVLQLPYVETFETTSFDPNRWVASCNGLPTIDSVGIGEPSPPYAARLNGSPSGGESFTTTTIDLSAENTVRLTYHYQQTGGGESPDSGDDLFVEFLNDQGQWQQLSRHLGADPDMSSFQEVAIVLPSAALHADFRLRFRNTATSGNFDDWFVDDVRLLAADAPIASDVAVSTSKNVPIDITLDAVDLQGDPIDFVILSLPMHGTLSDPGAGVINAVPYALAAMGDMVTYTPAGGFSGLDGFDFRATDGANDSNVAAVAISVGGPVPLEVFTLDTDPGWSVDGQWAFGQPLGGGRAPGDPTAGATGSNVYGYNLAGDYPNNLPLRYLTTTAIDCSDAVNTELRFRRWLGIESSSFDHAAVQVSNNGSDWTTVWEHAGSSFNDGTWTSQAYDISGVADDQATVYIRWSMGPTDGSVTYPGWNIDDIEIWGLVTSDPCTGDLDGDGVVDLDDLLLVLSTFGQMDPAAAGDVDGDGDVDLEDLLLLLANFGLTCG